MLERDDIKKNIAAMGARADYGTPQQFSDFVDAETKKFAEHHREGRAADGGEVKAALRHCERSEASNVREEPGCRTCARNDV